MRNLTIYEIWGTDVLIADVRYEHSGMEGNVRHDLPPQQPKQMCSDARHGGNDSMMAACWDYWYDGMQCSKDTAWQAARRYGSVRMGCG